MRKYSLITLGVLIAILLTGCFKLQTPEISYRNTNFQLVSFQEVKAVFNFEINNPNMVPLKGVIDYALKVNDRELFSGTSSEINVGSQKQESFTLDTTVNLPKAFESINVLIAELGQGKKEIPYSIQGVYRTTISGIDLQAPLKAEGAIPLPELPTIKLNAVNVEKFDLRKPTFKIFATLGNKNSVPLKLDSAIYKLFGNNSMLGQASLAEPLSIAPNGSQDIVLTTTLDLSAVDANLIQQILSKSAAFDLQQAVQSIK